MGFIRYLAIASLVPLAFSLSACSRDSRSAAVQGTDRPPIAAAAAQALVVHEGPHCGCCGLWREHMEAAGFDVDVRKTQELGAMQAAAGMPAGSPGMEMPDGRVQPYELLLVMADGSTAVFASYPKPTQSCCSINVDEHDAI